jgi:hypothetical protein
MAVVSRHPRTPRVMVRGIAPGPVSRDGRVRAESVQDRGGPLFALAPPPPPCARHPLGSREYTWK